MTRQTIIKTQGIISPEGIGPKGLAPPPLFTSITLRRLLLSLSFVLKTFLCRMGPDRATSLNYGIGGSQSTVTPLTRFLIPGIRIHCIIIRKNIDRLLGSIQCRKKRVSDDPISDQANICLSIPGFQSKRSGYGF